MSAHPFCEFCRDRYAQQSATDKTWKASKHVRICSCACHGLRGLAAEVEALAADGRASSLAGAYAMTHVEHEPDRPKAKKPWYVQCPSCEKRLMADSRLKVIQAYTHHEAAHRTEEGQPRLIEAPDVTVKLKPYCDDPARDEDGLLA